MALYLRYAVRSDLGLVRNNNEDSVYAGPRLLAIADGMGGHAAGEVASKIVISTLEYLDEDRRIDDLRGELRNSVVHANHRIAEAVAQRKDLEGMGTTLTALRFVGSRVGLAHVGDSRAYLLRAGRLEQITHDDTYVQYLVDTGKLTPDEAKDHPRKSVILRALLGTDIEPDVTMRDALDGDRYLLCSDGLSDVVSTETIADTLLIDDPQESADRLVELTLRGGAPDNVTVIVADVRTARGGETIDDVPVIGGAFVDPAAASIPGDEDAADSAAERAARMSRPKPTGPAPQATVATKRSWRSWLLVAGIVVVVVAAFAGVYAWTQTQYFVGKAGNEVAIYQGVNTELGPLKFFSVDQVESDLKVADLCPADRSRVVDGITASNRSAAGRIVSDLRTNKSSSCPDPIVCPPGQSVVPSQPTAAVASTPILPTSTPTSQAPGRTVTTGRTPVRTVTTSPTLKLPGVPADASVRRIAPVTAIAISPISAAPSQLASADSIPGCR